MTVKELTLLLVSEMETDGSTALVDQMRKDARAKVLAYKGAISSIVSSSVNGKSFTTQVQFTPLEVLRACNDALRIYLNDGEDDDTVSSTRANFGCIDR